MPFIDIDQVPRFDLLPGVHARTPYGKNIMLSHLEIDEGAEVPLHSHPHEQAGILLEGRIQLTIGEETRTVEPGALYIIPGGVKHRAVAVGGPAVILDIFNPIREDYAEKLNKYIPPRK